MNWFDIITALMLFLALINGYRKGFIMQLAGLAAIILAAVFSGKLAHHILPELNRFIDISPNFARVLSFIIAFGLIAFVISLIGRLLHRFVDIVLLSFVNRLMGSIIAMGIMMVVLSIILNLVLMLDHEENIIKNEVKKESFFYERVESVVPAIVPYLDKEFWNEYIPESYKEQIENKTDSILRTAPTLHRIDSIYQQRHFKVN